MADSLERIRKALERPVAWFCTRRTEGDKAVFSEPFVSTNPEYVKLHGGHDWQELAIVEAGAIRSLLAREAALREALAELAACKDMKERFQFQGEWTSKRIRDEYLQRQPLAHDAARAALASTEPTKD